ncbi:hypothetical protein QN277_013569 [Acacia crassicarpa]|uniref:Uncharacterized protein n=1 Tax=Acacia crassicarpa TaxID=499986 RepID=A0AAE1N326_9FABA|nr:hypothetical protein QN277_013569 [Acacia crassicarpa]
MVSWLLPLKMHGNCMEYESCPKENPFVRIFDHFLSFSVQLIRNTKQDKSLLFNEFNASALKATGPSLFVLPIKP